MELKQAIEKLNNFKNYVNCGLLSNALLSDTQQAIDTVLKELDNRIPRKDIEDKLNRAKEVLENTNNDDFCNTQNIIIQKIIINYLEEILNKE